MTQPQGNPVPGIPAPPGPAQVPGPIQTAGAGGSGAAGAQAIGAVNRVLAPFFPNGGQPSAANEVQFNTLSSPPPLQTMIYSPQVRVIIGTSVGVNGLGTEYDVSSDIVRCSLHRAESSAATFFMTLANKGLRYTPPTGKALFSRMDRIIVYMKRKQDMQVFSGYLDTVPYKQLYPGTVDYKATCTLKRIMHTWWNPGLPGNTGLLDQVASSAVLGDAQKGVDSGLGSMLRRILKDVGGWRDDEIFIANFPETFFAQMKAEVSKLEPQNTEAVNKFKDLILGAGDHSSGPKSFAGHNSNAGPPGPSAPLGPVGAAGAGTLFYLSQIVQACDERGLGPIVSDNTYSTATAKAGVTGQGSTDQSSSQGFGQIAKANQDLATSNRASDAAIIGVAVAAVETGGGIAIRNLSNPAAPTSDQYPNDGSGTNGTSCGIFQQQNFSEWGDVSQRMNPKQAAGMFFNSLVNLAPNWRNLDPGQAAQIVQRSAGAPYSGAMAWATTQVQAYRTAQGGAGSTTSSVSGTTTPGTVAPLGQAGIPSLNPGLVTGAPLTSPTPAGLGGADPLAQGRPNPDSEGAVNFMLSKCGNTPYVWGGKGPNGYDCLHHRSLIATDRGEVPIEEVTVNDRVLTRKGFRRVLRAWKVRDADVVTVEVNGRQLSGTPDHRVWTENRGWTSLSEVEWSDLLITCKEDEVSPPQHFSDFSVVDSTTTTFVPVYDLTIDGEHEFFADGVLVHNCSGLIKAAFNSIGVATGDGTGGIRAGVPQIPKSIAGRGDIYEPEPGHVGVLLGPPVPGSGFVSASTDGVPLPQQIRVQPWYTYGTDWYGRACPNGGASPSAAYNAALSTNNPGAVPPGAQDQQGYGTTAGSSGSSEGVARNLFSYIFQVGDFQGDLSQLQSGEKAFIDGAPLIEMIASICNSSLRKFQSSPNGLFYAYYPDWWGLDGKSAIFKVRDIELKDATINFSDDPLTTHVYVSGDYSGIGLGADIQGWLETAGVATVENEWLYSRLSQVTPGAPEFLAGKEILYRFGIRPLKQQSSMAGSNELEFLLACNLFMEKWAQQYQTTIEMTFMPELLPGMRIELDGHNLTVYVTEVTHTCSYTDGFSTSATIMAPTTPNVAKRIGEVTIPTSDGFVGSAASTAFTNPRTVGGP